MKETCSTCNNHNNCRAMNTMCSYPHPVPCVHWTQESDTEIVYHDKHTWKNASTSYAHMNGVSWLAWCTRCGAEGGPGGAEHRCYSIIETKKYKPNGTYRKSCSKEFLKLSK